MSSLWHLPQAVGTAEHERCQIGFISLNFRLLQCRCLQISWSPGVPAGHVSLDIKSLF